MGQSLQASHRCRVVLGADHQYAGLLADDEVAEAADDGEMTRRQTHNVARGVVEKGIAVKRHITLFIDLNVCGWMG